MLGLGDLLLRLKKSLGDDTLVRAEIATCIKTVLNFDLDPQEISISGSTVRIQTTPAKKNEIKLREKQVLEAVRAKTRLAIKTIVY